MGPSTIEPHSHVRPTGILIMININILFLFFFFDFPQTFYVLLSFLKWHPSLNSCAWSESKEDSRVKLER